jgi:hypothetical protein
MVFVGELPAAFEVTSTVNVHDPLAGTVPPVSVTLPEAVVTTPPAHVVVVLGVAAVVIAAG